MVARIHTHFCALHQTKLCNCNLLSPWGKYRYSRKIASKLGRVDVRRAALEVPCRRRRTQSSTALGRAPCYPILSFSCTPWIPMSPCRLGDNCQILAVRSDICKIGQLSDRTTVSADNCQIRQLSDRTTVRSDNCQWDNCQWAMDNCQKKLSVL